MPAASLFSIMLRGFSSLGGKSRRISSRYTRVSSSAVSFFHVKFWGFISKFLSDKNTAGAGRSGPFPAVFEKLFA